jgi:hypothetical protein
MTFTRANDMHQRFECRCKLRQAAATKAGGVYAWQQGLPSKPAGYDGPAKPGYSGPPPPPGPVCRLC